VISPKIYPFLYTYSPLSIARRKGREKRRRKKRENANWIFPFSARLDPMINPSKEKEKSKRREKKREGGKRGERENNNKKKEED